MKKYTSVLGFLVFMLLAIGMNVFSAFAINTSTLDPSLFAQLTSAARNVSGNGELLFVNNGVIDVVPNSYATSTNGIFQINLGSGTYPNPNGMLNTYATSSSAALLGSSFMGNTNNYVQGVFVQNLASGSNASADIVIANNLGTATSSGNYLDLGVANTGQVDNDHSLISPLFGYLYNQSGPLVIGTGIATSTIISAGMGSSSPSLTLDQYGHLITKGSNAGALSGCGTSPSVVGNDTNGVITLGSGLSVTSCTKAFANAFPAGSTVSCSVSSNSLLSFASASAVSTTGFTVGLSVSLATGKVYYQCMSSI